MSLPEIRQRMAQQADPEKKRPLADRVIHNDKSQEDLRRQVQEAARELLCRFPRRKS
jgi:dephospho-CoA kinase